MAEIWWETAKDEHVPLLMEQMRESDREELALCSSTKIEQQLRDGVEARSETFWHEDALIGIGGAVESAYPEFGVCWFVGTDAVAEYREEFLRATPIVIGGWLARFDMIGNFVFSENETSVRWLKRSGFRFDEAVNYGPFGAKFYPFWQRGGR